MKHPIPVILIVLCITSASVAREWHSYVSVGGSLDQPIPFDSTLSAKQWEPVSLSPATHFEVGIRLERNEWFLAYHASNSLVHAYRTSSTVDWYVPGWIIYSHTDSYNETSWADRRLLAGFRQDLKICDVVRITPLVGGAISLGRTIFRQHHFDQTHIRFIVPNQPIRIDSTDQYAHSQI